MLPASFRVPHSAAHNKKPSWTLTPPPPSRNLMVSHQQVQREVGVTQKESLELVRCLLRVSIFHLCYLRGLFPIEDFRDVVMKNLDGMRIQMLKPTGSDEAKHLISWVEHGVYDALRKGYLKTVLFGVCNDKRGVDLLEEYIFFFAYGDNGELEMNLSTGSKSGGRTSKKLVKKKPLEMSKIRYQVCRLMRHLVSICRTLEKVPEDRYLFMKLMYNEHTPEGYEPPHFIPYTMQGKGRFRNTPFTMNVGRIQTDHHEVVLRVKTMLDYIQHDEQEGEAEDATVTGSEMVGNMRNCCFEPARVHKTGSGTSSGEEVCRSSIKSAPYSESNDNSSRHDMDEAGKDPVCQKVENKTTVRDCCNKTAGVKVCNPPGLVVQSSGNEETTVEQANGKHSSMGQGTGTAGVTPPHDLFKTVTQCEFEEKHKKELWMIQDYLVGKHQMDIADVHAQFMEIPLLSIQRCFEYFERSGIVEKSDTMDMFIIKQGAEFNLRQPSVTDCANKHINAREECTEHRQGTQSRATDSQHARLNSKIAGSARTLSMIKTNQSRTGGTRRSRRDQPDGCVQPIGEAPMGRSEAYNHPGNWVQSQPTEIKYKARKSSIVLKPMPKRQRVTKISQMQKMTKCNLQTEE